MLEAQPAGPRDACPPPGPPTPGVASAYSPVAASNKPMRVLGRGEGRRWPPKNSLGARHLPAGSQPSHRERVTRRGSGLSASSPGENTEPQTLGSPSHVPRLEAGRDLDLSAAQAERGAQ